jgi:galactose mutarotase-like enzyme
MADTVRNHSDHATPFMLLYHCNLGYPLVHDGTELVVASAVYPRDARAEAGSQSWQRYEAASPLYPEQVFFHHLKHKNGQAKAALLNADFGLELSWETATLPYLTQWKNTRQGTYVCGLEPGNCIPEGQNAARESGRLVLLQPGETQSFSLTLRVLDGAEAVARCRREIEMLQREGEALPGCDLSGYRRIELQDAPETHEG